MAYLDTQIVSASIQEIGGGLSASSDELSWIQPSYLIAEIIVIQGFFGGSMIPTALTVAVVLFQGKQKAVAASFVSAAGGLAPTLGPVVGGWLTDGWSWRWLFSGCW